VCIESARIEELQQQQEGMQKRDPESAGKGSRPTIAQKPVRECRILLDP